MQATESNGHLIAMSVDSDLYFQYTDCPTLEAAIYVCWTPFVENHLLRLVTPLPISLLAYVVTYHLYSAD